LSPEELAAQQREAARMAAKCNPGMAEFPDVLNDYRYRVEKDRSVSAVNGLGEHIQFRDWKSFWKAAHPQA
jgi:hypothetical protein